MVDFVDNFIDITVSALYDDVATDIVLNAGHGLSDPVAVGEYNLVWWDFTNYPNSATDPKVEVVRVTALSVNTITVIRNQESSGATEKNNTGATYKMILSPTAKTITDLTADITNDIATHAAVDTLVHGVTGDVEDTAHKSAANGYPSLDAGGKVPYTELPALALTDVHTAVSEVEQLALTVQEGDVCIRTDENKSYIALNADNIDMGDWQELLSPPGAITSVFNRVGVVVATQDDYTHAQLDTIGTDDHHDELHEANHKSGGSDEILLDELGTPTDILTNNATSTYHGLLPKLDNVVGNFLNGTGNWSAISGGAIKIFLPAEAVYLPADDPALLVETSGSTVYAGYSYLALDDTTSEHIVFRVPMPDYDLGDITVTAYGRPATSPAGAVTAILNILTIGLASSEAFNSAVTHDTGDDIVFNFNTTELQTDIVMASTTTDPANVAADDMMVIEFSRNITDTLVGDIQLFGFLLEYVRA